MVSRQKVATLALILFLRLLISTWQKLTPWKSDLNVASDFVAICVNAWLKAHALVPQDISAQAHTMKMSDDDGNLTDFLLTRREVLIARLIAINSSRNAGAALGGHVGRIVCSPRSVTQILICLNLMPDYLERALPSEALLSSVRTLTQNVRRFLLEAEHVAPKGSQ